MEDFSPNNTNKKYILNQEYLTSLNQCNFYITNFIKSLRDDQELMFKIIQKSSNVDAEKCLSSFLINYCYENILSQNYIEDELLSLIERSLKFQIDQLKSKNDTSRFLSSSVCGKILGGLCFKNDIQNYFNLIFKSIIEKIENKTENRSWNFDISVINKLIDESKKQKKKKNKNINNSFNSNEDSYFYDEKEEQENKEIFLREYIPELNQKELTNILKQQDNQDIQTYILKQLTNFNKDDSIYSNNKLLSKIYETDESEIVLELYQNDFIKCINFIKEIFKTLIENIHLVPFSVKCICKIISELLQKKFTDINKIELISYLGEFFFGKLFNPIFLSPDYNCLISSFIISKHARMNINTITFIIDQLISGDFFRSDKTYSFTPFNWFFLNDCMNLAIEFFDKINKVNLPNYVEKLIKEPEKDNFYYNYFEENKSEFVQQKSICFSLNDFYTLFNIVKKNQEFFMEEPTIIGLDEEKRNNKITERKQFNMTLKKLCMDIHIKSIEKQLESDKKEKIKNFFLDYEIIYNEQFEKLMKIEHKKTQPNLTIPEIKDLKTEENIMKNNLIKIQNFLCKILYNYRTLNLNDFSPGIKDTKSILNELIKFLNTGTFVLDNSIPSYWYVNSLLKLLNILPENYKENDFEIIYNNLTNDLLSSIKTLDFELLSQIFERLKYTERAIKNFDLIKFSFNEISLNNIIKRFVETYNLPVEINIKLSQNYFDIKKTEIDKNEINNILYEARKKTKNVCNNIFEFTKKFPALVIYQQKQDIDLFELEEKISLPKKLEEYFQLIKIEMEKYKPFKEYDKNEKIKIYYNITNYIMSRIYNKIFPQLPDPEDMKIYHNSFRLSWIEPNNLIKNNNYIFDNFLPETKELLIKLDEEKSPINKLNCFVELSNKIKKIIEFNNGNELVGVEDTLPIFQYAVIKAQPERLNSNFKYINFYLNKELKSTVKGHLLSQIRIVGEFIKDLSYENFFDVKQEQFIKLCNDAVKM